MFKRNKIMTNNIMLVQLAIGLFFWVAGSAFICYRLAKYTKTSRMTSAQTGAILSLIPPFNLIYIAFLIYKRSKRSDANDTSL
ncbi:MAG: drug/metabolite transporter (DMT)-like permease [Candidatus Azotimanducaceae bacterium]|jgi:drug/metabolite transporter (DMT)-like permease